MNSNRLKELCGVFGPTGRESRAAEMVKAEMEKLGFTVEVDALGNVVARRGKEPYRIFVTHLDQRGWVTEYKDKEGLLHLKSVPANADLGEGWAVDAKGCRFRVILQEKNEWRAECLEQGGCRLGNFLVPLPEWEKVKGTCFASVLSDRAGVSVLLEAAREKTDSSLLFLFYTGRFLNFSGLNAPLQNVDVERLFIIEPLSCTSGKEGFSPGKGAVIVLRTSSSIPPRPWVEDVESLVKELKIVVQRGLFLSGSSAADVLSRSGLASLVLGVPVKYYASRIERLDLSDYENLKKIISGLVCAPGPGEKTIPGGEK